MSYRAPVEEMAFTLRHVAGLDAVLAHSGAEIGPDDALAILEEAGRFASNVIAPLNRIGDRHGTLFSDGTVTTAPGWVSAYRAFVEGGWNGVLAAPDYGGRACRT
ncbi:hypothetical protein GCM10025880_16910 [Methylorubrum aminovorans]|nr:hypothetical protein GCM10025880_16910 [Methylorubrum aminovorans]